jgi:hypothetical protein
MYYVRVISPEGVIVRTEMLYEPPDRQKELSLLLGLIDHWIDVARIPIDHHSDSFCVIEDDEFDLEPFVLELLK